jgi:gliding motility-associated-like protein
MFYLSKKWKVSLRGMMILLACFIFFSTQAQSDREFWFAAPEVTSQHSDNPVYFRVTAYSKDAIVTISQPANPSFTPIVFTVSANQTYSINFTSYLPIIENKPGNTALNYGILISSTASISAYYELASTNNPEIFPLKGNVSKGLDFLIPAQTRFNNQSYATFPAHNGFAIIATEDSTQVDITLTNKDEAGHLPGVTYSVTLNKGQTYAVNAASASVATHIGGSVVKSNKPICITIYDDSIVIGGWDLIGDQIVPINNTGKKFIVVKGVLNFTPSYPLTDFVYIWPTEDSTVISINGTVLPIKYNKGKSYELILSDPTAYITTDKPVYIFQLTGTGTEAAATSLPSIECTGSQSVSFVRPFPTEFYLNLFCKTEDIGSFLINGNAGLINTSMFSPVNGTNNIWQFARINVTTIPALNNLISISNATSITNSTGLFHLGFLNTSSGGSRFGYFSNYAQVASSPIVASTSCFGTDIQLQATNLPNVKYRWTGPHNFVDSVFNPIIKNAKQIDSGMYVVAANFIGCGVSEDSVLVTVNPKPTIHFLKSLDTVCYGSSKNIEFSLNGKAPWTVAYTNGTQNDTLKLLSQSPSYFTKSPTSNTIYSILNITDSNSCVVDINYSSEKDTLLVNPPLKANFDISKIHCEKNNILFSDSSKAFLDTLTKWHWIIDNGVEFKNFSKTNVQTIFNDWGFHKVKLVVQSSLGCTDTTEKQFFINPNPLIGIKLPEVCLADSYAEFVDTTRIADNSVGSFEYKWDFNSMLPKRYIDPELISFNAKTSSKPRVRYKSPGDYVISLRVLQKETGCVDSSRFDFTVNGSYPNPLFYILKDTALCSNVTVKLRDTSWVDIGTIGKVKIQWGDGKDTTIEDPSPNKVYEHMYSGISAPSALRLNYRVQLDASSGGVCVSNISKDINIVAPPENPIITTTKDYLCKSDTMLLRTLSRGGVPPFRNVWSSGNVNTSILDSTISGLLPGPVKASLEVRDAKGCVYMNEGVSYFNTMVVRDIPKSTIMSKDSIVCNGDAITLKGMGDNVVSYYSWYRNDTLLSRTSVDSIMTNKGGMYKVTVNDGKCNSEKSLGRSIGSLNIAKYTFSHKPSICIGVPLQITTNAMEQNNVHYKWDFGDGFTYLKSSPGSHKYITKGNYVIKLDVTNDYCPKYVYQVPGPTLKVSAPVEPSSFKYFYIINNPSRITTKVDVGYDQYMWDPVKNLDNPKKANPIFKGDQAMDYTLQRTDTVTMCSVTDAYEIIVVNELFLSVPNAFTPNNDGLNDVFRVNYSPGEITNFRMRIFNRWGKLMFMSEDINKGWDGRDTNGILQEMDAFNYFIEYSDPFNEGKIATRKGSVILFR